MDLLIEIGTEEIPSSYIEPALRGIAEELRIRCEKERFALPEPVLMWTPRRMTLHFSGVPDAGESVEEVRRGPPVSAAYDPEGKPTKAATGFAMGQGVGVDDLEVLDTPKGQYLAARVALRGAKAAEIVAAALPKALKSAPFPKSMRWTGSDLTFARPIRNLVVLLGSDVVPVRAAGVHAGRTTRGHPFLGRDSVSLPDAGLAAYVAALRAESVVADPGERRRMILDGLAGFLGEERASAVHAGLLAEVTNLAELPFVIEGRIDPEFLDLPLEVLEVAMRVHLRFFPVVDADGRAEARFLSVMDRPESSAATVRNGNERVLRSRLADAGFFLGEDRKRRLEDFVPDLDDKALHRDLGSYGAKATRLVDLAGSLAADEDGGERARRAARLCKADLVTEMVGEFPELQGTVGRVYAELDGEPREVAEAIEEHYRPRGPTDDLPRGPVALAVAVAEKVDNLVGFVSAAGLPSGSSDAFGLRRQALGLIRIAREKSFRFPLAATLGRAARLLPEAEGDLVEKVLGFVRDRLYQFCLDEGHRYDLVRACLASGFDDLVEFFARLEAVAEMAGESWWDVLVELIERTSNILKGAETPGEVDQALLAEPAEKGLWAAVRDGEAVVAERIAIGDYLDAGREMAALFGAPVHEFFKDVFVNVDDEALKGNRLALLARVNRVFTTRVADLSKVERPAEG